jgi:hypothetical protein
MIKILNRSIIIEHERTPGEVAVMCAWLKAMLGVAQPLTWPVSVKQATYRLFYYPGASGGHLKRDWPEI